MENMDISNSFAYEENRDNLAATLHLYAKFIKIYLCSIKHAGSINKIKTPYI